MISKFKYIAAAAMLALSPIAASAATLTLADSGNNFDLLADSYTFDEDFGVGTTSGRTERYRASAWVVEGFETGWCKAV